MIESRNCPVCGGPVMITYIRPSFDFYIEDGKIERDTNKDLWHGKDPYLDFHCTNDRTHNLHIGPSIVESMNAQIDWEEKVTEYFYEKIWPDI